MIVVPVSNPSAGLQDAYPVAFLRGPQRATLPPNPEPMISTS
jgi:hypothetical protein